MSIVAGALYARAGSTGFLVMALLCAIAVPLTAGLGRELGNTPEGHAPT